MRNISQKTNAKIEFCISAIAYAKMAYYVAACPQEIGWHGAVIKHNDNKFELEDVYLTPQKVTGTTVQTDDVAYFKWFNENVVKKGAEAIQKHRFQGHSHVNMSVTPSSIDNDYRRKIISNYKPESDNFYIFLIMNKSANFHIEIYDYKQMMVFETNDIAIVIDDNTEQGLDIKTIDTQMAEMVKAGNYNVQSQTTSYSVSKTINPPPKENQNNAAKEIEQYCVGCDYASKSGQFSEECWSRIQKHGDNCNTSENSTEIYTQEY